MEPIFCTSYRRKVKNHDGETYSEYKVFHPLIKKLFGDDDNLPDYVVTAHQIDPYFRVKMQGVIQKYVDSSISSTVNLPEEVTVETVADIYMTAYKAGLKGITVYREGSREGILQTEEFARKQETSQPPAPSTQRVPRERPRVTFGFTERVRTGEGNLYVTINEDENGICEVFSTIGKAGGNAPAQTEAICRLISLALRSGIEPREIVKQLKGISGPYPVWERDGEQILSTPDAIGKVLERYIVRRERDGIRLYRELDLPAPKVMRGVPKKSQTTDEPHISTACPECGSNIEHIGGCIMCQNCGWSKC
ncbi:MAG: hypothetical protein C4326_06730 [Ignavibacteria bacterium]